MKKIGIGTSKQLLPPQDGVPILVRFWAEDGVWNASAFDLGVAVCGDTFEEARENFGEALDRHFELLIKMGRCKETVARLRVAAIDHGFYERIKPRETVEKFLIPAEMEPCLA